MKNATADPSAAPQDDSAKGDDATYFQGGGLVNFQGSHRWNGVPPGIMKMQLRILRLRLTMTVPREMMRLIFKAVAMVEFSGPVLRLRAAMRRPAQDDKVETRVLRSGQDDGTTLDDSGKRVTKKKNASEGNSQQPDVLCHAAWHSLGWLFVANVIGVWLAVCLLYPSAGAWLRDWSYGRWMPVHLNFLLYGWMALPLVAWAMRIYGADRSWVAVWSRAALLVWSLALTIGGVSWLQGSSSGKLFLDWSGFARILFPLAILFLWFVLVVSYVRGWRDVENRGLYVRAVKVFGLVLLLLIPFVLYKASSPAIYPAVNPDTGGPTGASQMESTLIIVLILLLLPYGLTRRRENGQRWIVTAWIVVLMEAGLCLALGRGDVSHHQPVQFVSLGSLLVWVPLVPAYFNAFEWPRTTRRWRIATFAWWAMLVPTGWALFLPGVLDRFKFTDGLVGHSILAMAGFATSLLMLVLGVLLEGDAEVLNSRWAFIAWHGATLAYVVLFLFAGWREGADPTFTIVPGPARNILYVARLILGIAMAAASADWLYWLSRRLRAGSSSAAGRSSGFPGYAPRPSSPGNFKAVPDGEIAEVAPYSEGRHA